MKSIHHSVSDPLKILKWTTLWDVCLDGSSTKVFMYVNTSVWDSINASVWDSVFWNVKNSVHKKN